MWFNYLPNIGIHMVWFLRSSLISWQIWTHNFSSVYLLSSSSYSEGVYCGSVSSLYRLLHAIIQDHLQIPYLLDMLHTLYGTDLVRYTHNGWLNLPLFCFWYFFNHHHTYNFFSTWQKKSLSTKSSTQKKYVL